MGRRGARVPRGPRAARVPRPLPCGRGRHRDRRDARAAPGRAGRCARRRAGRVHPWWTELAAVDDARRWCERGWPDRESLLVVARGGIAGVCSLAPAGRRAAELSYWVAARLDDPTIAERACAALVADAFAARGLRELRFACQEESAAEVALAGHVGFRVHPREQEAALYAPGGIRTTLRFALTAAEWDEGVRAADRAR